MFVCLLLQITALSVCFLTLCGDGCSILQKWKHSEKVNADRHRLHSYSHWYWQTHSCQLKKCPVFFDPMDEWFHNVANRFFRRFRFFLFGEHLATSVCRVESDVHPWMSDHSNLSKSKFQIFREWDCSNYPRNYLPSSECTKVTAKVIHNSGWQPKMHNGAVYGVVVSMYCMRTFMVKLRWSLVLLLKSVIMNQLL